MCSWVSRGVEEPRKIWGHQLSSSHNSERGGYETTGKQLSFEVEEAKGEEAKGMRLSHACCTSAVINALSKEGKEYFERVLDLCSGLQLA